MTGEKNRYTTLEDKFKLNDTTLSTPKHDEMIMWLLNEDNVCSILGNPHEDCEFKWEVSIPYDFTQQQPIQAFAGRLLSHFTDIHDSGDVYPLIESLDLSKFTNHNDSIAQVHHDMATMIYNDLKLIESVKPHVVIDSEIPISGRNGFIIGYADIKITLQTKYPELEILCAGVRTTTDEMWSTPICIEVKPTIKSFGETLRQLRTYEHYLKRMPILFTADTGFQKAFETQGIKVIPYPVE